MRLKLLLPSLLCLSAVPAFGAIAQIELFSTTNPMLDSDGVTPLTGGSPSVDGDGAVIQVGYLAGVDVGLNPADFDSNPGDEWGTFIPLSGDGLNAPFDGSNPNHSSIGDSGIPFDGFFIFNLRFGDGNDGDPMSSNLPGSQQRLAIRFYNGTTVAGSSHYNIVTSNDPEWLMPPFQTTPVPGAEASINLDTQTLVWQDVPFQTSIIIPEPSTALLGLLGLATLLRRRR